MTPFIRATENRYSHGAESWVGASGWELWLLARALLKTFNNQTVRMAAQLNATEPHAAYGCVL